MNKSSPPKDIADLGRESSKCSIIPILYSAIGMINYAILKREVEQTR